MSWNLSTAAPTDPTLRCLEASKIKLWDFNRYLLHLTESVASNTQCLFRSFPIAHDSGTAGMSWIGAPFALDIMTFSGFRSLCMIPASTTSTTRKTRVIWRAMAGVTRGYTGYTDQEHMEKWHGKWYRKQGKEATYREKWPISSYYSHRRTCSNNRVMMKFKINKKAMDMRKIEEIVWYCLPRLIY